MSLRVLIFILSVSLSSSQTPNIRIRQGDIQGMTVDVDSRQVFAYLGIPYAKAPIDSKRFKPPEAHTGWDKPLQAIEFGPACPQPLKPGLPISEDCLSLNIWAPSEGRYRQFPVIVVFEGELFLTSDPSRFPGQDLAVYDLIIVTVNYRVNAFGFLSWQDDILTGNLGLMDQQLALRWIMENIEVFGGDVRSITLLGYSAGAASASFHLATERSRAFFHRAIILSGSSLSPWATNRKPKIATMTLARELGCNFNASSIDASFYILRCLQRRDLSLMDIVNKVEKMVEAGNPFYMFAPVHDGHMTRENKFVGTDGPLRLLENVPTTYPVLVGISQLDGSVMLYIKREMNYMSYSYLRRYGREVLIPLVNSISGNNGLGLPLLNHLVDFTYLQKATGGDKSDLIRSTIEMFTDSFFTAPVIGMAEILARRGLDIHLYINDIPSSDDIYKSPSNLTGGLHGSDMVLLFGPAAYTRIFRKPLTYDQAKQSETLKKMVYSFAVRGEPSLGVAYPPPPRWEKYTLREPIYALLNSGQLSRGYRFHDLAFWNFLLPDLAKISDAFGNPDIPITGFPPPYSPTTRYPTFPTTNEPIASPSLPETDETSYQSAVWVLVAVVLLMVISIAAFIICARRRQRLNSATLHVP